MPWVPALFHQVLGGLLGDADLNQLRLLLRLVLAKVRAQPALTIMDLLHPLSMGQTPNAGLDPP